MTFNIDGQEIIIPEIVAKDYKDTMMMDLDYDDIIVYMESSKSRNTEDISVGVIEELYDEISDYDTFVGRHYESA